MSTEGVKVFPKRISLAGLTVLPVCRTWPVKFQDLGFFYVVYLPSWMNFALSHCPYRRTTFMRRSSRLVIFWNVLEGNIRGQRFCRLLWRILFITNLNSSYVLWVDKKYSSYNSFPWLYGPEGVEGEYSHVQTQGYVPHFRVSFLKEILKYGSHFSWKNP